MRKVYLFILYLVVLTCPINSMCDAQYYVKTDGNANNNGTDWDHAWTLSHALDPATVLQTPAIINIRNGTYTITTSLVIPANNITLIGESDKNRPEINGNAQFQVINCNGKTGTTLQNLVIKNGKAANGGGVYCVNNNPASLTSLVIKNCEISGNDTNVNGHGGGLFCQFSDVLIEITEITGNKINGDPDADSANLETIHSKVECKCATWNNGLVGIRKLSIKTPTPIPLKTFIIPIKTNPKTTPIPSSPK
jgi:pectin methylesterase-like acyl-CoA thioesterase